MKFCARCKQDKALGEFSKNSARKDGVQTYCRVCTQEFNKDKGYDARRWAEKREHESARNKVFRQRPEHKATERMRARRKRLAAPELIRARNAARKAHIRRATPAWADKKAMQEIYAAAEMMKAAAGVEVHVDHVYPLRGENVCGLHVPENLQLLTWKDNLQKSHHLQ